MPAAQTLWQLIGFSDAIAADSVVLLGSFFATLRLRGIKALYAKAQSRQEHKKLLRW